MDHLTIPKCKCYGSLTQYEHINRTEHHTISTKKWRGSPKNINHHSFTKSVKFAEVYDSPEKVLVKGC